MLNTKFKLDTELMQYPKIDVHSHIKAKDGKLCKDQLEILIEDCQVLGIDRICVSIPLTGIGSEAPGPDVISKTNDIVIEAIQKYPGKLFAYAYLHPGYAKHAEKEMTRCMAIDEMIGIKLYHQYFFNDPVVVSCVESAAEKNAFILLHQGKVMDARSHQVEPLCSDGYHIAELARKVPTAKIICGHILGGGDWEWTIKALKDTPSVYVDTSGSVIDAGTIEMAVDQLGPERLFFATDLSIEEGVGKILSANISKEDKKAIFSDNFNSLRLCCSPDKEL